MKCVATVFTSFYLTVLVFARPGSILPLNLPDFSQYGAIYDAAPSSDGGVFIVGDFDEVDGVPRPGLAKLMASGRLDPTFAPEDSEIVPPTKEHMILNSVGLGWDGGSNPTEKLISLPGGRVIVVGSGSWEIRDPDGGVNRELLDQVVRIGEGREAPLFSHGDRLFTKVIMEGEMRFEAYRGTDLKIDASFSFPPGLLSIAPASAGQFWAFGRSEKVPDSGLFAVHQSPMRRLMEDGTEELSFPVTYVTSGIAQSVQYGDLRTMIGGNRRHGANVYDSTASHLSLAYISPDSEGFSVGHSFRIPFGPFDKLASLDAEGWFTTPRFDLQTLSKQRTVITDDPSTINREEMEGFKIPLSGPSHPVVGSPHTLDVRHLKDGGILVAGTRKFFADGTVDPEWHQPRCSRTATLKGLTSLNNGNIIVYGEFDRVDGLEMSGMVKLTPEGIVVPEFRPDLDLRSVLQVEERDDGNLIVMIGRGWFDERGHRSTLLLLNSEGRFMKPLYYDGTTEESLGFTPSRQEPVAFARQSDGTIVLSVWSAEAIFENVIIGRAYLIPEEGGTRDTALNLIYGNSDWRHRPLVTSSDKILYSTRIFEPDGTAVFRIPGLDFYVNRVAEFADGSILFDSGSRHNRSILRNWHPVTGEVREFEQDPVQRSPIDTGVVDHRGGVIAMSTKQRRFGLPSSIIRLERFGRIDPSFRVAVPEEKEAILYDVLTVGEQVWVAGRFEQLNGRKSGSLAVLDNRKTAAFSEWMEACAYGRERSNLQAHEDADRDGSSNLEEYAAGSDPFEKSSHARPVSTSANSWKLPVNLGAQGVSRRIEISNDLENWMVADEPDAILQIPGEALHWKMDGEARFIRVVISLEEE